MATKWSVDIGNGSRIGNANEMLRGCARFAMATLEQIGANRWKLYTRRDRSDFQIQFYVIQGGSQAREFACKSVIAGPSYIAHATVQFAESVVEHAAGYVYADPSPYPTPQQFNYNAINGCVRLRIGRHVEWDRIGWPNGCLGPQRPERSRLARKLSISLTQGGKPKLLAWWHRGKISLPTHSRTESPLKWIKSKITKNINSKAKR